MATCSPAALCSIENAVVSTLTHTLPPSLLSWILPAASKASDDGSLKSINGTVNPPAAVTHLLAWAMICNAIPVFLTLTVGRMNAPYGKYATTSWGPTIPGKLAWILQELPSFLIPACLWYTAAHDADPAIRARVSSFTPNTALLGMLLVHYFNRTFVFPLRIRGGKDTPLVVMLMALFFCLWNGYVQGRYLTSIALYSPGEMADPHFVLGALLWFIGLIINWQSDGILIRLRAPGETGYKIPRGGMFEYVSGANFFGEILEWTGYALAAWNLPAAAFALYTFCNIGPRGAQHHAWLKRQFKDYPRQRWAVIPFIW